MSPRYELRVDGCLSERARSAFRGMRIEPVPTQTVISGEVGDQSELRELLERCSVMGLPVVSVRQLPDRA